MKNNFQKIPLLFSVLLLVFLCALFTFLYNETNNNDQKAALGLSTWQTEANRRNEITSLDSTLMQIAGSRSSLDSHFAESSDVVPFLDTIEELGVPAGAQTEIDSVTMGASNNGLVVGLKATGSFDSVYKFITLLENSPYEIDFQTMDLHRSSMPDATSKNNKNPEWEADFNIQLLSFVP